MDQKILKRKIKAQISQLCMFILMLLCYFFLCYFLSCVSFVYFFYLMSKYVSRFNFLIGRIISVFLNPFQPNAPFLYPLKMLCRGCIKGGSRAVETSKMERFVIIVNGFQPLTIITKRSILDVAAALDPPLCIEMRVYRNGALGENGLTLMYYFPSFSCL